MSDLMAVTKPFYIFIESESIIIIILMIHIIHYRRYGVMREQWEKHRNDRWADCMYFQGTWKNKQTNITQTWKAMIFDYKI